MAKYEYDYPHPAVATDCVVFGFDGRDLKVLLIERGVAPYKGMWAFPGGFLRMDETAEQCAIRELREETGLVLNNVRQLGAFSGVNRDPRERIVSIAFYALARHSAVRGGDDAAGARWWSIDDIPQLAFDHDYILRQAMRRIRQDIHFEPIGFGLLEEEFTIADLQRLYECILGVRFDRRNFHRKMIQTGILQEVDREAPRFSANDDRALPSAQTQFFGSSREMKTRSIDELFGDAAPTEVNSSFAPQMKCCEAAPMASRESTLETDADDDIVEVMRHSGVGRKGKLFRFDKERYDQMKDGGTFRLEF